MLVWITTLTKEMTKQKYYTHLKEFAQAEAILCNMDYERVILGDRPDIIIETKDGKKIGLEMTECHASTILSNGEVSRERAESRANKICKLYKDRLEQQGVKNTIIYLSFTPELYEILSKLKFDKQVYQEVLDAIEVHREEQFAESQGNEVYSQWLREHYRNHNHYKYVNNVSVYEIDNLLEVHQQKSVISKTVESECIDHCIGIKEKKLNGYKILNPEIEEYWLGIYFPLSSERYFEHLEGYKCRDTEYSRVYLLEHNQKMQVK